MEEVKKLVLQGVDQDGNPISHEIAVEKRKNPVEFIQSLGVPLENEHFSLFFNEPDNAYDLVLQQEGYAVNEIFLDMLGLFHLIGKNCPDYNLRVGAKIKEKSKIVAPKPKLILN